MKTPKGKLIPIGGNEARKTEQNEDSEQKFDFKHGVLEEVIKEMKGEKPRIVLLPLASQHQEEFEELYKNAFKKLGHDIEVLIIHGKKDADKEENLEVLRQADGVFITGGDQSRLIQRLEDTEFMEILRDRYFNDDFVIAGTSAGAMVMSEFMIHGGKSEEAIIKGITKIADGFGFLPGTIIDTHFLSRGRFSRLTEALLLKRDTIGIGLCEDTAVVITKGHELRAIGSGTVTIIEGEHIENTNYEEIEDRDPIYIDNLKVHILSKGSGFDLNKKEFKVLRKRKK
ncbi:MAG TPA: cyanophycinase [Prolixibacteraceae bacterium]|nr:cyanophycinase [Prolixibacteraceae bacterium]